jgi:hypothetical protein
MIYNTVATKTIMSSCCSQNTMQIAQCKTIWPHYNEGELDALKD